MEDDNKEKKYAININGENIFVNIDIFKLILNLGRERSVLDNTIRQIYEATLNFKRDKELADFVRKLFVSQTNITNLSGNKYDA